MATFDSDQLKRWKSYLRASAFDLTTLLRHIDADAREIQQRNVLWIIILNESLYKMNDLCLVSNYFSEFYFYFSEQARPRVTVAMAAYERANALDLTAPRRYCWVFHSTIFINFFNESLDSYCTTYHLFLIIFKSFIMIYCLEYKLLRLYFSQQAAMISLYDPRAKGAMTSI